MLFPYLENKPRLAQMRRRLVTHAHRLGLRIATRVTLLRVFATITADGARRSFRIPDMALLYRTLPALEETKTAAEFFEVLCTISEPQVRP